jgi:RNA polymerase sigma-70 factor (ECF subfamily)
MSTPSERTHVSERAESQRVESAGAEIIRRAQRGDAAAFERIYQLYGRRIYALCLRIARNPTEAEDLTQEAFLRAFRKIQTFRGESAFSTWLYRLALNVVLMKLRKKQVPEASLEEMRKRNAESTGQSKEVGGPDLHLAGLMDRLNLERAVEQLPSAFKTVFVLHDIQGYKHHEIAEMMDLSIGTSKGRLHRARTRLRELLQDSQHYLGLVSRQSMQSM